MLNTLTITEAHKKLKAKEISCEELVRACLDRIAEVDPKIHAVVYNNGEQALAKAKEIDRKGSFDHPLTGIPYLTKDVFCEKGVPTTACSNILRGKDQARSNEENEAVARRSLGGGGPFWHGKTYHPPYDSTTTKRLSAVGAISLGKSNTDEFTMGSSTETSCYGTSKNPWNPSLVPGGSSGGSAAAVAADECIFALGTDTGGSIRQPAALCGCTGLKVTYGRTSRYGVMSMASSLDTIGHLCKSVEDAAIILETIAGKDAFDATTPDVPVPKYRESLGKGINGSTALTMKGMKIGLPREYFIPGMDREVETAVREAAKTLEKLGAKVSDVSLPHTKYGVACYYVICPSEVSSNMARYDGIRYGRTVTNTTLSGVEGSGVEGSGVEGQDAQPKNLTDYYERVRSEGFGTEVKRRIMIGTYALSAGYIDAYYWKAMKVRTLVKKDFDEAFKKVDLLLAPVSPTPAFKFGEKTSDPVQMYLSDVFTIPGNLAGIPALSIPCGFASAKPSREAPKGAKWDGLPIGLQIMGPQFKEETLLNVGHAYQQATDWHKRKPSL